MSLPARKLVKYGCYDIFYRIRVHVLKSNTGSSISSIFVDFVRLRQLDGFVGQNISKQSFIPYVIVPKSLHEQKTKRPSGTKHSFRKRYRINNSYLSHITLVFL